MTKHLPLPEGTDVMNLPYLRVERKEWPGPWATRPHGNALEATNKDELAKPHIRLSRPMGRPSSRVIWSYSRW